MRDVDQAALDIIKKWESGEYNHESQSKATLQILIAEELKDYYKDGMRNGR